MRAIINNKLDIVITVKPRLMNIPLHEKKNIYGVSIIYLFLKITLPAIKSTFSRFHSIVFIY